jgi:hypothetical protein
MKLDIRQKLALATTSFVAVASCIIAGPPAGGGGPGFGPQNNPGMQASQFGQAAAGGFGTQPTQGGPGFGASNNPGVSGSAYGRSIASDASSGRSDARNGAVQGGSSGAREEAIDTDADSGNGKARSKRETHNADAKGSAQMLSRISGETGVPVNTLLSQKSATGLGYGDLETANLLAKASGQSFDSIVAKFKAGEGFGKIAHDMGLNLGKIVSAAHRSSLENTGKDLGSEKGENSGKRRFDSSILNTGITPIPSAMVSPHP